MDKQYKPVPDVEELRYKGTPEKPDIKIFVSHRIDQDSETIDNPLYVNVRCGAVYDERKNITILGDDTGDNISEKRESFCELTVQYWAWKNVEADYYGLCHYRRYLSFAEKTMESDFRNQINESVFSLGALNRHFLLKNEKMCNDIKNYDIVVPEPSDIRKIETPMGFKKTIEDHWKGWDNVLIKKETINILLKLLADYYPEYIKDAQEYLSGHKYRGYNCFILKKDIFQAMCKFQFDILFALKKKLDMSLYSQTMCRTLGFMGEVLFGIFIYHLEKHENYKLKNLNIVFFQDSKKEKELLPAYSENNIPIVLMSSSHYVPYLGVFLKSLSKTCSYKNNYDIVVLHKEIIKEQEVELKKIVEGKPNFSLRFYNPKVKIGNIKFHIASPSYSDVAYYRLLAPWILYNYDKAIIMDCDIIVKRDLSLLYNIDLGDNLAAGVRDIVYQGMLNGVEKDALQYAYKTLQMKNPYNYINTGVLVMALERVRKKYLESDFINLSQKKKFRIQEQDVLNIILEDQVQFLDLRWNYYVEMNGWVTRCLNSAPAKFEKEYRQIAKSEEGPYLIHFANIPKPWDNPGVPMANEFWMVARETSFYEVLLSRLADARMLDIRVATYDIQCRMGIFDTRSGVRKLADKLLPYGTLRREFAKRILPKDSKRWRFCKQIYYIFRPQYRPVKEKNSED